jgi:hypothetical protein
MLGIVGLVGIGGATAATAVLPQTAAAFNNNCRYSQIGNYWSPLYTTNGYGTQYLQPCDGVYVVCYVGNPYYGPWSEYVNWTSPYLWRYQGYIRDSDLQTYGLPPRDFWRHC